MKIYFSTMIACLLAFVGCQNEELVNETTDTGNGKKVTLTATIAGAANSRVVLNEVNEYDEEYGKNVPTIMVNWKESGEEFTVYNAGYTQSAVYEQIGTSNNFSGDEINGAYAYYGYDENRSYDLSSQDGTLNENYILMQAPVTDSSSKITFKHHTAILRVEFNGVNNQAVTKIVMDNVHTGSNNESITVTPTPTQASLGYFYIFLPIVNEGSYGVGHTFNFTVTASDTEYTGSLTIPNKKSIVAGKLYTAKLSIIIPYVTFSAVDKQKLNLVRTESPMLDASGDYVYDEEETLVYVPNPYPGFDDDGVIEYSVGDQGWLRFTPNTGSVTFGGEKGDLRLRGISPNGTLYAQIVFDEDNTTPVDCSGDIRTLVDWKHHETAGTSNAIFRGLFKDCSVLTSAPELPATTLAEHCYDSMFAGCTNLAAAPELPAITLAPYCYYSMFAYCTNLAAAPKLPATDLAVRCYKSMFYGCTSLEVAPELPATTLANDNECYGMMFHGCAKLTAAPELPATTLVDNCYNGMFAECSELTSAPALPATTLADNCYFRMFAGCSKLTSAPALLATTLVTKCYYDMFRGCTKLNSVTMLAMNIKADCCLTNWLKDVAATGTFTKAADLERGDGEGKIPTGASGIPSSWDVVDYEAQ